MATRINLGNIAIEVTLKDIKNVHLSVHPPNGRVSIAAPARMSLDTIRVFAITKLDWIKRQQAKLQGQEREPPREFLVRESHYVWGRRYLLDVIEHEHAPSVELKRSKLLMQVRHGTATDHRHAILDAWYRDQIKTVVPALLTKWKPLLKVNVTRFFVQRMKTRWGSCNPLAGTIRLNTDLAKKPRECLEYIVVHEMLHILEPTHNERFLHLMDRFMPKWQFFRELLNRLPVRHESWEY